MYIAKAVKVVREKLTFGETLNCVFLKDPSIRNTRILWLCNNAS